jgi:hypothetical protein
MDEIPRNDKGAMVAESAGCAVALSPSGFYPHNQWVTYALCGLKFA